MQSKVYGVVVDWELCYCWPHCNGSMKESIVGVHLSKLNGLQWVSVVIDKSWNEIETQTEESIQSPLMMTILLSM